MPCPTPHPQRRAHYCFTVSSSWESSAAALPHPQEKPYKNSLNLGHLSVRACAKVSVRLYAYLQVAVVVVWSQG